MSSKLNNYGNAVMLSRYGDIYRVIDNKYHPNPGLRDEDYPEIERCIDWLYLNEFSRIKPSLDEWVKIRVSRELDLDLNSQDLIKSVMFSDMYTPCDNTIKAIKDAENFFMSNLSKIDEYSRKNETDASDLIVNFINEYFLRVREGGKVNSKGEDSIYFRISSHGYDWRRTIVEFLWDIYGSTKDMPSKIWIGHDAETNPPEVTLFEGTPDELFDSTLMFEKLVHKTNVNQDRENDRLNKLYYKSVVDSGLLYTPYK